MVATAILLLYIFCGRHLLAAKLLDAQQANLVLRLLSQRVFHSSPDRRSLAVAYA
jgi:hypothetical protein